VSLYGKMHAFHHPIRLPLEHRDLLVSEESSVDRLQWLVQKECVSWTVLGYRVARPLSS
jgi:hypothetical protein